MTSHELAKLLLSKSEYPVCFWKYTGGDDELVEVEDFTIDSYAEGGSGAVILYPYKQG